MLLLIVTIDLNSIDFDNDNFDEDHPINIILLDLLLGVIELNNIKHAKKINKELVLVEWHPTRVWDQKRGIVMK